MPHQALLDADPQPANVLVVAHGRLNKYALSALLHGDASRWYVLGCTTMVVFAQPHTLFRGLVQ